VKCGASDNAGDYPLAARGVYEQNWRVRGCREFVAVDSRGELLAARLVKQGRSSARAEDELWQELDEHDPIGVRTVPLALML
jgi:hypothetical protein